MNFTDTHVHLHFPDYDQDREDVLKRAHDAGVGLFINVGTDLESSKAAIQLARLHPNIHATAGIHPHDAKDGFSLFEEVAALAASPEVVAVGEVGLDFFRNHSPRDVQAELFRRFLRLHRETGKPLVIHCRDAYEDLLTLLKEENASGDDYRGVMHCYSSDKETMKAFLDLGLMISFAGPLTYKKNDALREACRACPRDRLLLETDAPFLPPQSIRGKRNESCHLVETAGVAAGLHGVTLEELASFTTANARKLFKL